MDLLIAREESETNTLAHVTKRIRRDRPDTTSLAGERLPATLPLTCPSEEPSQSMSLPSLNRLFLSEDEEGGSPASMGLPAAVRGAQTPPTPTGNGVAAPEAAASTPASECQ